MQFEQYPSYKNSGVEWLGDVPEHWQVKPNKYVFKIQKRIAGTLGFNVLSITQKGLKIKDIESNAGQMAQDYSKYQIVNIGDFAMNHMDLLTGWIDIAKVKGVTSPDYRVFEVRNKKVNKEYFLHLFQLGYRNKILFAFGQGAAQMGRWRLQSETFNTLKMPFPSIEEQQKIVAFLDTETTRIDTLIAKQEKLIELLEEQRKSIISHAVTKGLNTNAPMKDSGVEWLGEVPSNWDVVKLRWITQDIKTGGTPSIYVPTDDYNTDYIDWFTPSDFNGSFHLKNAQKKVNPQAIIDRDLKIIPENSILLIGIGATLGKVGYITVKASSNQQINYLSLNRKKTELIFLVYYFFAHNQYIKNMASASTLPILNQQKMGDIFVSLPNVSDQQKIINFLDSENLKFDNLISKQKSLIEKLKEYRASIISHAVTGKIDVREFGA